MTSRAGQTREVWVQLDVGAGPENGTVPLLPPVPPPPAGLWVADVAAGAVTLAFRPSPGAAVYEVEWSRDGTEFMLVDEVEADPLPPGATAASYVDLNRFDWPSYYRLRACAARGPTPSEPSNAVSVPGTGKGGQVQ